MDILGESTLSGCLVEDGVEKYWFHVKLWLRVIHQMIQTT